MDRYLIGTHIEAFPYEETKISIYNKNTDKTFILGEKESSVFKLMNGTNTAEDIHSECPFYTVDEIKSLAAAFDEIGLFTTKERRINPFKIKVRLFNPNSIFSENGLITTCMHYLICLGAPSAFLIGTLLIWLNGADIFEFIQSSADVLASASFKDIILIVLLSLLCLALHETAHMITARHYGVNVPEIGVMLYFLIPCAYTNISGINLLREKSKRIIVLLSGTFMNIGIIGICFLISTLSNYANIIVYCSALIIINFGTVFMNTIVLLKFDGYYILETLLDEPGLREKARAYSLCIIKIILSLNKENKRLLKAALKIKPDIIEHTVYLIYTVISVAYVPFIMLSTVIPFFSK